MNKICTSIEQSKKLIDLGIDVNTADMYYSYDYNIDEYEDDAQIIPQSEVGQHFSLFPEDIPAWSLTALIDLMPKIGFGKPVIDLSPNLDSEEVAIFYHSEDSPYIVKDNLVDACYEMIIKLHEQKLL